jgi:protein-S-isoprenylcysteine O-methyltransferase Ste14
METVTDGAKVRFPPPLVYAAGLALGIAAGRLWNLPGLGFGPYARYPLGGMLVVAGVIVSAAGVGLFIRNGTAIIPHKPAAVLVTSGIYRWTRNPMYVGMALTYAGVAVLLNSLPALVLLPVVLALIQYRVIAKEEAYLERAFGAEYGSYKKQVRRWI